MPHKDPKAKSEYMRERYRRKANEIKAYQRKYRQEHQDQIREKRRPYQRKYYLQTRVVRKIALLVRAGGKCGRCDFDNLAVLEFHHRDPAQKEFTLNHALATNSKAKYPWSRILNEADKCEVLCANCHALEHNTWTPDELDAMLQLSERYFAEETDESGNGNSPAITVNRVD